MRGSALRPHYLGSLALALLIPIGCTGTVSGPGAGSGTPAVVRLSEIMSSSIDAGSISPSRALFAAIRCAALFCCQRQIASPRQP